MTSPERTARAEQACAELAAAGQPVTFTAVAGRAGIGRATLYRHPALRALIDSHRRDVAGAGTPTGLADDIAALRTAIEAVAARVRHHEEQIRQLNRKSSKQPERSRGSNELINRPMDNSNDIGRLILLQLTDRSIPVARARTIRTRLPFPLPAVNVDGTVRRSAGSKGADGPFNDQLEPGKRLGLPGAAMPGWQAVEFRRRLTGVVDWTRSCTGPADFDAGHCRL
jgi:hypothetical protein